MRILIVDDDAESRRVIQLSLSLAGHEVIEMENGQAAWEYLQREPVRVVITDWLMPCMDGLELTQRIRGGSFKGYIYIIILTVKNTKAEIVAGLNAGADDFLTKPFNADELLARVAIGQRILDLENRLTDANTRLEALAMRDSLTNLFNRWAIYAHAEAELNRSRREDVPLGLAMLDVDHFKPINDTYGHPVGDSALQGVANAFSVTVRSYDWVGRWGGDEFLLVMPGSSAGASLAIVERVRAQIARQPVLLPNGGALAVKVSAGVVATGPDESDCLDTLIQRADLALYDAKNQGRDRVVLWQETEKV